MTEAELFGAYGVELQVDECGCGGLIAYDPKDANDCRAAFSRHLTSDRHLALIHRLSTDISTMSPRDIVWNPLTGEPVVDYLAVLMAEETP